MNVSINEYVLLYFHILKNIYQKEQKEKHHYILLSNLSYYITSFSDLFSINAIINKIIANKIPINAIRKLKYFFINILLNNIPAQNIFDKSTRYLINNFFCPSPNFIYLYFNTFYFINQEKNEMGFN